MHQAFVSYSSADKRIADAIVANLEAHGVPCWYAPRDIMPGIDWSEAIIDAIVECDLFILVLSETSNVSEQVKREIQNAVTEKLAVIPFKIHDVHLSKHMRYFIGTPHWFDATAGPLEDHLDQLSNAANLLLVSLGKGRRSRRSQKEAGEENAAMPVAAAGVENKTHE